jgi:hypothetical protein
MRDRPGIVAFAAAHRPLPRWLPRVGSCRCNSCPRARPRSHRRWTSLERIIPRGSRANGLFWPMATRFRSCQPSAECMPVDHDLLGLDGHQRRPRSPAPPAPHRLWRARLCLRSVTPLPACAWMRRPAAPAPSPRAFRCPRPPRPPTAARAGSRSESRGFRWRSPRLKPQNPESFKSCSSSRRMAGISSLENVDRLRMVSRAWPGTKNLRRSARPALARAHPMGWARARRSPPVPLATIAISQIRLHKWLHLFCRSFVCADYIV